jgi:hypothetical protein
MTANNSNYDEKTSNKPQGIFGLMDPTEIPGKNYCYGCCCYFLTRSLRQCTRRWQGAPITFRFRSRCEKEEEKEKGLCQTQTNDYSAQISGMSVLLLDVVCLILFNLIECRWVDCFERQEKF